MKAKKPVKVTIVIDTNTADEIVWAFLKNPNKPNFYYNLNEELTRKIGKQVCRKSPELVAAKKEREKVEALDKELKANADFHNQNEAIFAKYKPLRETARKQGEEISRQANQFYVEDDRLRQQAVTESDALFNAEFKKRGIKHWFYMNGWIAHVEDEDEKAST
jgi:hypothetical protein